MDSFLSLPISVWANEIAFFLEIHDLFSLRLTSKYCNRHTVRILPLYESTLSQQRESLSTAPDYVETRTQVRKVIFEATHALGMIDNYALMELRSHKIPPEQLQAFYNVMAFLLTGKQSNDPRMEVLLDFPEKVEKLRNMEEVPKTDLLGEFLQKYPVEKMRCATIAGQNFYQYLEAVARTEGLKSEEFRWQSRRIITIDREKKAVSKLLARLGGSDS